MTMTTANQQDANPRVEAAKTRGMACFDRIVAASLDQRVPRDDLPAERAGTRMTMNRHDAADPGSEAAVETDQKSFKT
jgi:hypothetical protein